MVDYLGGIAQYGNYGSGNSPFVIPTATVDTTGAYDPTGAYLQSNTANGALGSMNVSGIGTGAGTGTGINFFPTAPKTGGFGAPGSGGLGFNLNTAGLALQGLGTIGSLWQAWQSNKLARDQFKSSKEFANINLANGIKSYNTNLEDRTRARTFTEGGTDQQAQSYIDKNRLADRQVG
jgi:hypothetical protein